MEDDLANRFTFDLENTNLSHKCIYCNAVIKLCRGSKLYIRRHRNTKKCKNARKKVIDKLYGNSHD